MARERHAAAEACPCGARVTRLTSCLATDWDPDYTKSGFRATHQEGSCKPEFQLAWQAGLHVNNGKLFVLNKMLIPGRSMQEVVQEWANQQQLHAGFGEMHLHMKSRFKFPFGFCKTLKAVCGSCQVCQTVKPPNQSRAGYNNGTPSRTLPSRVRQSTSSPCPPSNIVRRLMTVSSSALTATLDTSWQYPCSTRA